MVGANAYTWVAKYIIKFHNSVDLLKLNNENKRERERKKNANIFSPFLPISSKSQKFLINTNNRSNSEHKSVHKFMEPILFMPTG